MRGKIHVKGRGGQKHKIKIRYLMIMLPLIIGAVTKKDIAIAENCPDLRIVFARGSGGELNHDQNYLNFKETIETKLKGTGLRYEFIDLDYPAIGVGMDNLGATVGAYFGAGEAYEFGDSVKSGVKKLDNMINGASCSSTKYVLGGYSQGAMVISKALPNLKSERIIYVATFGDPKLYLPEGEGLIPDACSGKNLSEYRTYVPDCHAYKGLLGAYIPYQPEQFAGKLGTWCNKNDIFCSSHLNINDHISYVADNLYEDASRVIMDKVATYFRLRNDYHSPHDTAIIIDSTGSMEVLIDKFKAEALRLAQETFNIGGRVALYDYRDLDDPYQPVEYCNFETCTLETFSNGLAQIYTYGGGDEEESTLSASFHVMQKLNWQRGATKSLIVLTDAGFLSPDRDGITYADAVALSKSIDPVNFYIITNENIAAEYVQLAEDTGGRVVTNTDELSLLTDYIIDRYDSLPRVEEEIGQSTLPIMIVNEVVDNETSAEIRFSTDGEQVIVILNEQILGITSDNAITISGLDRTIKNSILLVPIKDGVRGEGIEVLLEGLGLSLRAPNTGRL